MAKRYERIICAIGYQLQKVARVLHSEPSKDRVGLSKDDLPVTALGIREVPLRRIATLEQNPRAA